MEKLRIGEESVEIEAKRAGAIDKSILQTVSAFSNEPGRGGGYLLLGVEEDPDGELLDPAFNVVGVKDPGQLQADLATQCRGSLQPPVRPEICVERHEDKTVLVVFVPEAPAANKPVFIVSEGLPGGAYRRIGNTDQHCTEDDLELIYQGRSSTHYDSTPVEGTTLNDIDPNALNEYRRRRRDINPQAIELQYSDDELLHSLNATTKARNGEVCLTVAGLILFGKEPSLRRYFPMTRADYILVEGREWVRDPEKRYTALESRGPLLLLIPRVVQQVLADIPATFSLNGDGVHRQDVPLIPGTVIREAIVNALMHRNYRSASPVQVIRYQNRIEIRNSGFSLKPEERLGEPGSYARNPTIAAVLHEIGLAETKGSGIRTMRELMKRANLTPPFFESDRQKDEFHLMILVHHLLTEGDVQWLEQFKDLGLTPDEARALIVARESGAITNAMFRELSGLDTLASSKSLARLRVAGLLTQKGKGKRTYYLLADMAIKAGVSSPSETSNPPDKAVNLPDKAVNPPDKAVNLPDKTANLPDKAVNLPDKEIVHRSGHPMPINPADLPLDLVNRLELLDRRSKPDQIKDVIYALCLWRSLSAVSIATLIGRTKKHVLDEYLTPMLKEGRLELVYPKSPAHPRQAYRAVEKSPQQ
jgi:ATP-dependent DNA helicase RecG